MKKILASIFCAATLLSIPAFAKPVVNAVSDHEPGTPLKIGDAPQIVFTITEDKEPCKHGTAELVVSQDGGKILYQTKINLAEGKHEIKVEGASLSEPGFLRYVLNVMEDGKKLCGKLVSYPVEAEKIVPAEPSPADFKAWWDTQLKSVESVPADFKAEKLDAFSNADYDSYKLRVTVPDGCVWGFLTVPKANGPHPLSIVVPGAGPGEDKPRPGRPGVIQAVLNVHGFDPMQEGKKITDVYAAADKSFGCGYSYWNRENREKFFFHRVILGLSRMVDALAARPDVKKDAVCVSGFSQGGAMSLILAAINPNIKRVTANMPAMCDLFSCDKGRGAAWPYTLIAYKRTPGAEETARYYDVAHFAEHIRCPVVVVVGCVDDTSRPSTVYAAYNVIPGTKKRIFLLPRSSHTENHVYYKAVETMLTDPGDWPLSFQAPKH